MKRNLNYLLMCLLVIFFSVSNVFAADSINVDISADTISSSSVFGVGSHTIMYKTINNGHVYCAEIDNPNLRNGEGFLYSYSDTKTKALTADQTAKIGYICKNRNVTNRSYYYATNIAIWKVLGQDSDNVVSSVFAKTGNTYATYAQNLVTEANKTANQYKEPTVKINTSNATQKNVTIGGEYYYIYGPIAITKSNADSINIELTDNANAKMVKSANPTSTTDGVTSYTSDPGNFYVIIKADKVDSTATANIKASVTNKKYFGKIYIDPEDRYAHNPDSKYGAKSQSILTCNNQTVTNSDQKSITFDKEKKIVKISKTDAISGKEVPGAKIHIYKDDCKTGTEVTSWTSGATPKEISLAPGKYCFKEEIAPDGYIKSSEEVTFTVKEDGTVDGTTTMKNEPIKVIISKKSINGRSELPGAKLKITDKETGKIAKDLDGKSLEWVSGNKEETFHLGKGVYILSETIAPKGYELSDTVLEFTVTEDGKVLVDKKEQKNNLIVFKNTPEAEQVPTGSKFIYVAILGILAIGTITYFGLRKKN